ncbi:MAG TPA: hypothetical protein PLJ85_03000, partial [Candidatus Cloacimonas sp.]|nr:hypothetical protein [Candidatus Cloacimonas sp.]
FFKKSMFYGICRIGVRQPIERSSLKKVCFTAFAESEFGNPEHLPNRSSAREREKLFIEFSELFGKLEFANPLSRNCIF